ncbi:cell surface protein [Comamonas sp. JUb58]|uniref:cell surface protein n=1 Tax=Comamonas sp. JUb58 TaxID=2485114 RepID=UPI00105F393B|nr:cell surface protein [Comamonas sp. JUb58]TDS83119.1 hypothetical protein EDF71_10545 [Comamonas sp. JUb58]
MKKNVLALSIAAMIGGFAGAASAQNVEPGTGPLAITNDANSTMDASTATKFAVSEGGSGHILLVPYFTSQEKNMSVIHVVNTDLNNGKAVKVRFRGAANSDDLLDFTVFLSPGDVWTGAVQANENGSYFRTNDGSCTIPDIRKQDVQFGKSRLNKSWDAAKLTNNTKEGYVEILNAADIPGDKIYGANGDAQSQLYTAIKHVNGVAPCTTTVLEKTLNYEGELNTEAQKANYGFNTPTGQLTGDWYILNVDQTTTFSGAATALKATTADNAAARGNYVLFPQQGETVAAADSFTADPLLITKPADKTGKIVKGPLVTPNNADFPDLSTPYFVGGADTAGVNAAKQAFDLTASLAKGAVSNQYATDASLQAKTDWVFSMPTRRYSVAANYAATTVNADNYAVFNLGVNAAGQLAGAAQSAATVGANPTQAATELNYFNGSTITVDAATGNLCVGSTATKYFDREESSKTGGAFTSPVDSKVLRFCGETSVLSFTNDKSVLGATVAHTVTAEAYVNGWANVSLGKPASAVNVVGGLPVVGSSFIKLTNAGGLANGFSGTYGITWPHRYGN